MKYKAFFFDDHEALVHHQIKGARWGHRRFQNYDGSLTPEGRIRYGVGEGRSKSKYRGKIETSIKRAESEMKKTAKNLKKEAKRFAKNEVKRSAMSKLNKVKRLAEKEATRVIASKVKEGSTFVLSNLAMAKVTAVSSIPSDSYAKAAKVFKSAYLSQDMRMVALSLGVTAGLYAYSKYKNNKKQAELKRAVEKEQTAKNHYYKYMEKHGDTFDKNDTDQHLFDKWMEAEKTRQSLEKTSGRYKSNKKETAHEMRSRLEKDPGYIKVKDKRSGGQAFVKVENKKTAATSLSYLGYSVQDIADKLHIQESEVEYFLYGGA